MFKPFDECSYTWKQQILFPEATAAVNTTPQPLAEISIGLVSDNLCQAL